MAKPSLSLVFVILGVLFALNGCTSARSWPPRSVAAVSPKPPKPGPTPSPRPSEKIPSQKATKETKILQKTASLLGSEPPPASSDRWIHVVSRKMHGPAGVFDLDLGTGPRGYGVEPRSGPNQQVAIKFSQPVSLASVTLTQGVATIVDVNGVGQSPDIPLPAQSADQYVITLADVADAQLVGISVVYNWIPADPSEPPDPTNPQTANFYFGVLLGDINENTAVTNADVALCSAQTAAPADATNFLLDVNANGVISNTDVTIVKTQVGKTIAEPTPAETPTPSPSIAPPPTPVASPSPTPTLAPNSVKLQWSAPLNTNGVASYNVWFGLEIKDRTTGGRAASLTSKQSVPKTDTQAIINLPDAAERYFAVTAVGTNGSESSVSNVVGYPSPLPGQ
jgi:hypothetical protein